MLSLADVHHDYGQGAGRVSALRGISLDVKRGQVTLVAGPSGGGKTTALLVMGLLLRPTSGQVLLAGSPMQDASQAQRTRERLLRLGFVFQQFNLLEALSALENVAAPLRYAGVEKRHALRRAAQLLEALGIGERMRHRPADLSGGQQQRVAVARALALGPDVVLADEPTANLDSHAGARVIEQLTQVAREHDTAVVIVTHDTRVAPYADRVLHLEDGRILEQPVPTATDSDPGAQGGAPLSVTGARAGRRGADTR